MVSSSFLRDPIPTRKASSPRFTAGSPHELHHSPHSGTAKSARSPRPAVARFTHLGHGPMQLPLSLLHAQGAISRTLSVLEIAGTIVVRGNRASREAFCELGGAQVAAHRRRAVAARESRR